MLAMGNVSAREAFDLSVFASKTLPGIALPYQHIPRPLMVRLRVGVTGKGD